MSWMNDYKVDVPEGKSGDFVIEKFKVSKKDADRFNIGCMFNTPVRQIRPGNYTRLIRRANGNKDGILIMSDTPAEIRDHMECIYRAEGHVVIAGLGLGMVVNAIVTRKKVLSVTVIEIEPDIIQLTGKWIQDKSNKVKVIKANIFKWNPHERMRELNIKKFDYIWFDIWNEGCEDLLEEKKKLYRRWGRWAEQKRNWLEEILATCRH